MRIAFCLGMALLLTNGLGRADYRIPSVVFRASEFDDALEKAQAETKPLAMLKSMEIGTSDLCAESTRAMISTFRNGCVIVHFNSREWETVPVWARSPFTIKNFRKNFGRYIPAIAFFNPYTRKMMAHTSYDEGKSDRNRFRDVARELSRMPIEPIPPEEAAPLVPTRTWANTEGHSITAALVDVVGEEAIFRNEAKELLKYPVTGLSEADQALIKELLGGDEAGGGE